MPDRPGDEIVGIFEGVADIVQTLNHQSCAFVIVMRDAVKLTGDSFAFRRVAYQFVIHKTIYDFLAHKGHDCLTIYDVRLMYDLVI